MQDPRVWNRTAVSIFFFIAGSLFASWASRIPTIKDAFLLNEAQLGGVLFMLPMGSFLALPIAGWWVSRFGSRFTTSFAALGNTLMLAALGYTHTVTGLSIFLFLFGFFGDLLNIAMNTQALDVQEIYRRPIMSSFHGMWSLGAMSGAIAGGWFMKHDWGTSIHFLIVALIIIALSIILPSWLLRKDQVKTHTVVFAWPDKALFLLGIICLCCALCEGAMADWSSLYYRQVLNDPGKVSTTGYTAFTFTMALGRLVGDRIIYALGNRTLLILDGLCIAVGMGLAIALPVPSLVILGFSLVGFGVATVIPMVYSLAGQNKKMAPSAALAAVSTIGFTGFLAGPPLIGFIAHQTGLRLALLLVLVMALVIALVSRKLK